MMLGCFVTFFALNLAGIDPLLSIPLSFLLIGAAGAFTEVTAIEKIMDAPMVTQIFTTFSLLLIIRYGGQTIFGASTRSVTTWYSDIVIGKGWYSALLIKVISFFVALAIAGVFFLFLKRTYTGIAIRATAQDMETANLMGIPVKRMRAIAFALGCAISAVGGSFLSLFFPIRPVMGGPFGLYMFVIVVLGGFGSMKGTIVGGLIIGVTEAVAGTALAGIAGHLKTMVVFIVFLVILVVKPSGLFGRET